MMVFAGREGRWKYDCGIDEFESPMRPWFGAVLVALAWSCRRGCSDCLVVWPTEALETARRVLATRGALEAMVPVIRYGEDIAA
jgi:hypothetical protein